MSHWINSLQIFLRGTYRAAAWKMKNRAFRSLKLMGKFSEIWIRLQ